MNVNEIISSGLLELYVLGETNAVETADVQSWISLYPEIASEVNAIELAMETYAQVNAIKPSPSVKDKLFSQIGQLNSINPDSYQDKVVSIENPSGNKRNAFWKMAVAASVTLFIASAVGNYIFYNKYQNSSTALAKTQEELTQANLANSEMIATMRVLQNKNADYVKLAGLPDAPDAVAKIYWIKNTEEVYVDPSNLPEVPSGKQYQLWAIVDGKPVDGGMIDTRKKSSIQKMKSFGKAQAFAITLESEGGNPTPKGKMYVMGSL